MAKRRPPGGDDPRWTSDVAAAPGELKIVQAFLNTARRRKHAEELASPRALARWLARWRLVPEELEIQPAHLALAIALREGYRALVRVNSGRALDEEVAARLENAAAEVPVRVRVSGDGGIYLAPATDAVVVLGRLVGLLAAARLGPSWPQLKVCGDPACGAAFYDTTKSLNRKWCTLRCGNRMAARASRRRRRNR